MPLYVHPITKYEDDINKLTNQKLMIAIAMIALFTAIGSMSIGSMSNNSAFARSREQ